MLSFNRISLRAILPMLAAIWLLPGIAIAQRWYPASDYTVFAGSAAAIDPSGTLYIGGTSGWLLSSEDQGSTWQALNSRLELSHAAGLMIHPGGYILADWGIWGEHSLSISTDSGATWRHVNVGPYQIITHALDADGAIYAGTDSGMIHRSTDHGATWERIRLGTEGHVWSIAFDRAGRILAAYSPYQGPSLILRSANSGMTWDTLLTARRGTIKQMRTGNQGEIFGWITNSSYCGFLRSTDDGASWDTTSECATPREWDHFLVAPEGLFVCYGTEIYRSTDHGASFHRLYFNLLHDTPASIFRHPDGSLYITTRDSLLRSTDSGTTWQLVGSPFPERIDAMFPVSGIVSIATTSNYWTFIGTEGMGAYRSEGYYGTENWWRMPIDADTVSAIAVIDTSRSYAATDNGIFITSNGGTSWQPCEMGIPRVPFTSVAGDASQHVYAGTSEIGIYRSTDRGTTWEQSHQGLPQGPVSWLYVDYRNRVYTAIAGRMFRSLDRGIRWEPFGSELPVTTIRTILVSEGLYDGYYGDLFDPREYIMLGTERGLFYSTDSARSWHLTMPDSEHPAVHAIQIGRYGDLAAGTDSGVYIYSVKRNEWRIDSRSELAGTPVVALTMHPCKRSKPHIPEFNSCEHPLFALTADGRLFIEMVPSSVDDRTETRIDQIASVTAIPNPFKGTLRFTVRLTKTSDMTLEIFSMTGEPVAVVASGRYGEGEHEMIWEPGDLPDGVYLYRLKAGGALRAGKIIRGR